MGSIAAMATKTFRTLRSTRQVVASSHVLQQRVESIRARPWSEFSNATALALLMQAPTESEREHADRNFRETVTISRPDAPGTAFVAGEQSFTVERQHGRTRIVESGDLGNEPTLLVESLVRWRDADGPHQRRLRTIVCRAGLTRSGIFGSDLGQQVGR